MIMTLFHESFWHVLAQPKCSSQASKSEALPEHARAKHQGPWCLLFVWSAPCWRLGSADQVFFAKVSRKFCEEVGESQNAFWREWPSKPCKKCLNNRQQSVLTRVSVMLAAGLQGYEKAIRDTSVWFDRWWMKSMLSIHTYLIYIYIYKYTYLFGPSNIFRVWWQ